MENIIQMQKEFEVLINELKKLKTINQLASENTNNSGKVISEMENFVNIQKEFWESISEDYQIRKGDLDEGVIQLTQAVEKTDKFVVSQTGAFKKLFQDSEKSISDEVTQLNATLQTSFEKYIQQLDVVLELVKDNIGQFTQKTHDDINNNREILLDTIGQKIEETRNEIAILKKEHNSSYDSILTLFKTEIRDSKLEVQNYLENLAEQQNKGFTSLEEITRETKSELVAISKDQSEKIFRETKINGGILIVLVIINLAIIILLLVK